jgi:putative endonuclease
MDKTSWYVYVVECLDGSLYTGITTNLEKRMRAHKNGTGSKYVRSRGFCQLIAAKPCTSKSAALKEEYQLKKLSKEEKRETINKYLANNSISHG